MNKPIIKNWMRYWGSALAISGMLVVGACGSEEKPVEEIETPQIETVNREVEVEEYQATEEAPAATTEETTTVASNNWNRGWNGADISTLLNKYPEVNEAITTTLIEMTNEPGEYNLPEYDEVRLNNSESDETAFSNNGMNADVEEVVVYDVYVDPSQQLTDEERQLIDDARSNLQTNNSRFITARPDVNYSELAEEIEEEMNIPREMKDAKLTGTVLVQFVVGQQGQIESAEVLDGIISQVKEDGTVMTLMRLTDKAEAEVKEEIVKEDLIEFKGEEKARIIEALKQESVRAVGTTSGKWQPAMENNKPAKLVMIMPIRFDLDD